MAIFHNKRRDIVSKTLFDVFKLTAVAGCVSGFFQAFNIGVRVWIFCIIALAFIIGFISCPLSDK